MIPPRLWRPLRAASLAAALAAAHPLWATELAEEPIRAERLQPGEKIVLDGTLSHPAWQRAPVFDRNYEVDPVRGREPADHPTKVQVLYDEHALYVGVTALDREPQRIVDWPVRHDQVNRTQDFVVLYVDAIGARKSAQFFRASAAGSTADGLHTAANDSEDFSPDFDYDSAVSRHAQGYTVVFRIPYSTLRYTSARQGQWRIMVGRRIPRENVMLTLTVPLPHEALSFIDKMQPLDGFTPPQGGGLLQLRPTVTMRATREQPYGGPDSRDTEARLSLDAKWRPLPELVADATLNPDFSQVELDTPQLSRNTRFALLLTEKRPFFLESTDLLVSPTDALYSRSITDPRWGLRATWRGDLLTGSAMALHDKGGGDLVIPAPYGSTFARQPASDVVFSRAQVHLGKLVLGSVAAGRRYAEQGEDLGSNAVGGLDAQWFITESLRLNLQALGSRTTALADANGQLHAGPARNGGMAYADLYHRSEHTETELSVQESSQGFRNDMGYVTQSGARKYKLDQHYHWFNVGPFNETSVYLKTQHEEERGSGRTVFQQWMPGWSFTAASNTEFIVEGVPAEQARTHHDAPLRTSRYVHAEVTSTPLSWVPLAQAWVDAGRMLDIDAAADELGRPTGRVVSGRKLGFDVQTRPAKRLELNPRLELLSLDNPVEGRYRESAARLLAIWHVQPRQSVRLILQRNSFEREGLAKDATSAQSLTYAWRRSAGTVFYLGATRGNTGLPAQPSHSTEVFAKLQLDLNELRW